MSKPHGKHKMKSYNRYTQKKPQKESKHNTKDNHQITREDNRRRKKEDERTTKIIKTQLTK